MYRIVTRCVVLTEALSRDCLATLRGRRPSGTPTERKRSVEEKKRRDRERMREGKREGEIEKGRREEERTIVRER